MNDIFLITSNVVFGAEDKDQCHTDIVVSVLKEWPHLWIRQQANEYFQCNVVSIISGYGTIHKHNP